MKNNIIFNKRFFNNVEKEHISMSSNFTFISAIVMLFVLIMCAMIEYTIGVYVSLIMILFLIKITKKLNHIFEQKNKHTVI